ncbi:hypothetical protein BVC80_7957g6 [Macleaya cordata]|uniref:Retrotransposon gag domain-containing protein n=1 Tax=Macleaya cordata TaxID=56857 RepID=A0A200Q578_MACCD|nr:hypothetical protein BVC80_7957g6 [Macleaya cordata]
MARGNSRRNVEELRNRIQRVEVQLEQVVGIQYGMAVNMQNNQQSQNHPTPPAAVVLEDRLTSILEEFQRLNPTEFAGTEDPLDAKRWFMGIHKKLITIGAAEEHWVRIATFMLKGEVDLWWDNIRETHDVTSMTWVEFEALFFEQYFLETNREKKSIEFAELIQGDMSVTQYEKKFRELSRYGPHLVSSEVLKVRKFERGLKPGIRGKTVSLCHQTYARVVHTARVIEADWESSQKSR